MMTFSPPQLGRLVGRGARNSVLVIAVAGLVGFLVVSQLRGQGASFKHRLQQEDEASLTRILASTNSRLEALQNEQSKLRDDIAALQTSSQQAGAAAKAAEDQRKT